MGGIIIISILIGRDISVHIQFGNCPYGWVFSRHWSGIAGIPAATLARLMGGRVMLRPTLGCLAARLLVLSLVSLILCACEVSAATCGDGLQEEGEQCEDGNQVDEK